MANNIQTTKFSAPNCKELQQLLLIIYKVLPFHLSFIKGVDCLTCFDFFIFSVSLTNLEAEGHETVAANLFELCHKQTMEVPQS